MSDIGPGRRLPLVFTGLDDHGSGTAQDGSLRVHVAGALPGEEALVEIEHVSPHQHQVGREAWGRVVAISRESRARALPFCPAYGSCGGCALQHLSYQAQLDWKRARVEDELRSVPALAALAFELPPCAPSPQPRAYRNQAKYVFGRDSAGQLILGAYAPRSHHLVDVAGCALIERPLDDVARAVRDRLGDSGIAPYDEKRQTGCMRYVVLRANAAGRVLVTLVTARPEAAGLEETARRLHDELAAVDGVVQNVNPSKGNVLFGAAERTLAGVATLDDTVNVPGGEAVTVRLSSRAFFQLNRGVAALAYGAIRDALSPAALGGGRPEIVDLYCGVGGISFALAAGARLVTGIEENAAATAAAEAVARTHALGNLRFVTGDAATAVAALGRADALVLNPPRAGCAPEVLAAVARLGPLRVAYLSCNPRTLARDLAVLVGAGFRLLRAQPLDMLPHTPHVETLALLALDRRA